MAATDARPVPRKNVAYRFYFAIRKPSDSTLITTWTGQDSEVSLDGAAYSDCTNEATEIGTTGTGYIDLTASEMNADCVILKVTVTNTGAVPLVFTLFPEEVGDYRSDTVQLGGSTQSATDLKDFADTGYDPVQHKVQGAVLVDTTTDVTNGVNVTQFNGSGTPVSTLVLFAAALDQATGQIDAGTLANNTLTAAALASDAVVEIQNGLATSTEIGNVQTEVNKIPRLGETYKHRQISSNAVAKSADVIIEAAP